MASYVNETVGVSVNLETGAASGGTAVGDTFDGIENLEGSTVGDTLTGDAGVNYIHAHQGDDTVNGGAGDDHLAGGSGGGGAGEFGNDVINGGDGHDTVDYSLEGQLEAVTVNLATGVYGGQAAGDTLTSIESITGTIFNDALIGDAGANELNGHDGDDALRGGPGADALVGGTGIDTGGLWRLRRPASRSTWPPAPAPAATPRATRWRRSRTSTARPWPTP